MMRALMVVALLLFIGCQNGGKTEHEHAEHENWAVTSWGSVYEIFAECEPLVAGRTARSHTHVTILSNFAPLREGSVAAVLRPAGGDEVVFTQETPTRDGIFSVEITPASAGEYELVFRVQSAAGTEDIASGKVSVGTAETPGALVVAPVYPGHTPEAATQPVSFLKEQQWKTAFSTAWAAEGEVSSSIRANTVIRAASGSDVALVAPLDGIVSADTRAFVGREVKANETVVSLAPRVTSGVTLSELEAETGIATARLRRLEALWKLEAVSQAEVDAARARVASLAPQLEAVRGSSKGTLAVRAPFDGRIAESRVTPGGAVAAGDPLVRIVRTPPVWLEAAVAPRDAARLVTAPRGVSLQLPGGDSFVVTGEALRLVSVAPEIDRRTGMVTVILESTVRIPVPLGSVTSMEILLAESSPGIVIPALSIVDDAGASVIFVQLDGESFDRREVRVLARRGPDAVVDGVRAGERLVVVGGAAIRRAALLSTGEVEGHVH